MSKAMKEKIISTKIEVLSYDELSAQDKDAFLVTGNGKHFPKKPFVVTPAELVEIMQNENEFLK